MCWVGSGAAGEQSRGLTHSDSVCKEWVEIWRGLISCPGHAARLRAPNPDLPGPEHPRGDLPRTGAAFFAGKKSLSQGKRRQICRREQAARMEPGFLDATPCLPVFTLKLAKCGAGGKFPLCTTKATAAVGEDDVATSAGIPNANPEARQAHPEPAG